MTTRYAQYRWNRLTRSAKVGGGDEFQHSSSRQGLAGHLRSKFSQRGETRVSAASAAVVGRAVPGDTYVGSGPTVRDLMTGTVATIRADEGIQRAACLMKQSDCGALPVVDSSGRLIGIITDRDITVRLVARALNINSAQVSDCMTSEAFACRADSSVEACMRIMSWHQIRRVPIVDYDHRVIGIVSQSDLVRHAAANGINGHRALAEMLGILSERVPADQER